MSKKNKSNPQTVELAKVAPEASSLYLNSSPIVRVHIGTIESYCEAMAPGTMIDPNVGTQWQFRLWNAMFAIINLENPSEMHEGCDELIRLFARHAKGALSFTYTQRFIDRLALTLDNNKLDMYSALCALFSSMCTEDKYTSYGRFQDYTSSNSDLRHLDNAIRERLALYISNLYK